ncbi:MAG: tryptophan 2,3-dioxygenase [Pedobacter sp.]|nr:MAG: tryptophan 2,3-dioxygenase [Pedobacter sp.]
MNNGLYYSDYLQLDKILDAQALESHKSGSIAAHDEMMFIVIHQAYELWFKQILVEIDSVLEIMRKPALNDNSTELQTIVHRLNRVIVILKLLVQQVDIVETMSPMDFLDFRDQLVPASGFQSWQFKTLEAKLGLRYECRHGKEYYIAQLRQQHIDVIKKAEEEKSIANLVNTWLERMPFFDVDTYWKDYVRLSEKYEGHPFWADYEHIYSSNLAESEQNNRESFRAVFSDAHANSVRLFSSKASRAALFVMLYRGYPMLELPFQLLQALLEIDNQLGSWRYRHLNMVRKTIGSRMGTGGSNGAGYLKGAMDKHYIFSELSGLTSFLINRQKLPLLPVSLVQKLGYNFCVNVVE